jgi:hypothetical protein
VLRIKKRTVPILDLVGVSRRRGERLSPPAEKAPDGYRQKECTHSDNTRSRV